MSSVVDRLKTDFKDLEYRHVYDEGFLNSSIATQLKVLREERGWTQDVLADRAGMNQSRISELEDVNFNSWTIRTLRKLARAFDLRLKISFEEFGTLLHDFRELNRRSLSRHSFGEDTAFKVSGGGPACTEVETVAPTLGPMPTYEDGQGLGQRPTHRHRDTGISMVRREPKPTSMRELERQYQSGRVQEGSA